VITVKLALMQANSSVLDIERNCAAIDRAAGKAAQAGAAVLLTPELFPVGYAPLRVRAELDPQTLADIRRRGLFWNGRLFGTRASFVTYLKAQGATYTEWARRYPAQATAFAKHKT